MWQSLAGTGRLRGGHASLARSRPPWSTGSIRCRLLSLRHEENRLFARGIDLCHETALRGDRFGRLFAADISLHALERLRVPQ